METSCRTLSAPGSVALAVFAYSYHRYSELNAIYVKYTNIFINNIFYILFNTAPSVQEYISALTFWPVGVSQTEDGILKATKYK